MFPGHLGSTSQYGYPGKKVGGEDGDDVFDIFWMSLLLTWMDGMMKMGRDQTLRLSEKAHLRVHVAG